MSHGISQEKTLVSQLIDLFILKAISFFVCFLGDGSIEKCLTQSSVLFIIYLEIHFHFHRDKSKVIDYFQSISPFLGAYMQPLLLKETEERSRTMHTSKQQLPRRKNSLQDQQHKSKFFCRQRCIGLVASTLLSLTAQLLRYRVNEPEETQSSQKLDLPFPLFRNTARLQQQQICAAICV